MGCDHSKHIPNYTNVCSPPNVHTIPGLCGDSGDCGIISPEWTFQSKTGSGCLGCH